MKTRRRLKFELLELDRRLLFPEAHDLERVNRFYAAASDQLLPGERRVAAFEGSLGPPNTWVTTHLVDAFQRPRLFALTDRRLLVLRIGKLSDRVTGLELDEPRLSIRLLAHRPPAGAGWGRLLLRRSTGKVLRINYTRPWTEHVQTFTRWLPKGSSA